MNAAKTLCAVVALPGLMLPLSGYAHDYPTVERVEFVEACALEVPSRPHQEMVYKCSCVIDHFADQASFDDFVEMSTAAKAYSIAGERGNAIRDSNVGREQNKRYKQLLGDFKKACLFP